MNRTISVIIVTWNALDHLKTFLPTVMDTDYDDFEVIIADNASADASAEWVRNNFPECKIVTFSRNHGYCGGNNRAVDYASGEILVFLNNDVSVEQNWLDPINRYFKDPEVAVIQPKMRSYREPELFEYAGAAGGYLDMLGYPFCRGRVIDHIEQDRGQYDDQAEIFWASGAAFAIRKDLFLKYNGFDEDFRFHMEEIDLCWRMLNDGLKILYCPESVVYHLGGGSLPMASPDKTYFNFRNSLSMLWKNASTEWLKKKFFLRLCLDGLAAFHALLKGKPSDFFAIFRAHLYFYISWPSIHSKRKILLDKRLRFKDPEQMLPVSIITEYFIRKNRTFSEIVKY